MATEQLERAKALLKAKHYDEARIILEGLWGDPTAERWLAKLNEIAPVEAVSDPVRVSSAVEATTDDAAEIQQVVEVDHPAVWAEPIGEEKIVELLKAIEDLLRQNQMRMNPVKHGHIYYQD